MVGRSKRKIVLAKAPTSGRLSNSDRRESYLLWLLHTVIKCGYNGVIKAFVDDYEELAGQYRKVSHLYARFHPKYFTSQPKRVKNTVLEGKLAQHVAKCWDEMGHSFPKWLDFFAAVKKSYGSKRILAINVRKILKAAGVHTIQAKNVANAENAKSCENRLEKISILHEYIRKNNIKHGSKKVLYSFDACCLNQLVEQDERYLSPHGVEVFKVDHFTTHSESLSLLLLVDNNLNIVHYELRRNKEDGGTDWKVFTDFFVNAIPKAASTTATVYFDNAPCHKKAFESKLDDDLYKIRKEKMLKVWSPIFAPPCTPESNLAEYFFADLKKIVKSKLGKTSGTMKGPDWYQFIKNIVDEWISTHRVVPSTIEHIDQYLNRLVKAKGNIQLEAIHRAGYKDKEDLFLSIHF